MAKGTILSGMRPTGPLHVGHLVGALSNWVALQKEYECYFMIADWHALMSEYENPKIIAEATRQMAMDFVACGLDPAKIFVQSDVAEHLELYMVLSCVTPLGWLERCPTYKEQMQNISGKDLTNYAFLGYPTLQAADILIYKADTVPVGEDQLPHVELTREIARRFNNLYGPVFPEPQAKLTKAARLLGLDNRKMSKSYGNFIALSETPDTLRKKVMTMYTDPERIRRADPGRPEVCLVHRYYEIFAPEEAAEVAEKCRSGQWGCTDAKKRLIEILIAALAPIQERRQALEADPGAVDRMLAEGAARARAVAAKTMSEVRPAMGLKAERR
jgi:tryptophanyl-tRNA synthetase